MKPPVPFPNKDRPVAGVLEFLARSKRRDPTTNQLLLAKQCAELIGLDLPNDLPRCFDDPARFFSSHAGTEVAEQSVPQRLRFPHIDQSTVAVQHSINTRQLGDLAAHHPSQGFAILRSESKKRTGTGRIERVVAESNKFRIVLPHHASLSPSLKLRIALPQYS